MGTERITMHRCATCRQEFNTAGEALDCAMSHIRKFPLPEMGTVTVTNIKPRVGVMWDDILYAVREAPPLSPPGGPP